MTGDFVSEEPPAVLHLTRQSPGEYGWAIVGPSGAVITVGERLAMGLTRWEARQTLGLLGPSVDRTGERQ